MKRNAEINKCEKFVFTCNFIISPWNEITLHFTFFCTQIFMIIIMLSFIFFWEFYHTIPIYIYINLWLDITPFLHPWGNRCHGECLQSHQFINWLEPCCGNYRPENSHRNNKSGRVQLLGVFFGGSRLPK